ncbi:MAG: holo-ACP synthase [Betaproteobacteria bacterium]|nr:holo-ACP synthase [Betaproteobacteria bacterium]
MIFGIGTDIVHVSRMERLWQRYGDRLAGHVLSACERPELPLPDMGRYLAKRFAAKEAFAKAAGTGLRAPVSLVNLSVMHDSLGRPSLAYAPALEHWLQMRGVRVGHVSISDERDMVVAFVVLEGGH